MTLLFIFLPTENQDKGKHFAVKTNNYYNFLSIYLSFYLILFILFVLSIYLIFYLCIYLSYPFICLPTVYLPIYLLTWFFIYYCFTIIISMLF